MYKILLLTLVAGLLVFGCYSDSEESSGGSSPGDGPPMTLAANAHTKDGVALCPVMGKQIGDLKYATGSQEYEGKTYYFC